MNEVTKSGVIDFLENKVNSVRVLVIGDVMLDRYFFGTATRISPEAPVPVNRVARKKDTLGGAANVAHNLARLGSQVYLAGVIGDDHHGRLLKKQIEESAINADGIIKGRESTTTKIRILGGHQQMIRVDFEETEAITGEAVHTLQTYIHDRIEQGIDAIIISDYGKGVNTIEICQDAIKMAKTKCIPVLVDPKGIDWQKYTGATYITPNVKEASEVLNRRLDNSDDEDIKQAATLIREQYAIDHVMITRSERGLSMFSSDTEINIPTVAQEVFDVSGAGDTVISVFAAGIGGNLKPAVAAKIANFAAGIEVERLGTYAVSNNDLVKKLSGGNT